MQQRSACGPCGRASSRMSVSEPNATAVAASIRFHGERRSVVVCRGREFAESARAAEGRAVTEGAALAYGFAEPRSADAARASGWEAIGPIPTLARRLRLGGIPLLAPFGRR